MCYGVEKYIYKNKNKSERDKDRNGPLKEQSSEINQVCMEKETEENKRFKK